MPLNRNVLALCWLYIMRLAYLKSTRNAMAIECLAIILIVIIASIVIVTIAIILIVVIAITINSNHSYYYQPTRCESVVQTTPRGLNIQTS